MNDMRVYIKDLAWGHVRAGATVGEALEQLGRDVAGHALAARVDGREVDLGCRLEPPAEAGGPVVEIEPILPDTPGTPGCNPRAGNGVLGARDRRGW